MSNGLTSAGYLQTSLLQAIVVCWDKDTERYEANSPTEVAFVVIQLLLKATIALAGSAKSQQRRQEGFLHLPHGQDMAGT